MRHGSRTARNDRTAARRHCGVDAAPGWHEGGSPSEEPVTKTRALTRVKPSTAREMSSPFPTPSYTFCVRELVSACFFCPANYRTSDQSNSVKREIADRCCLLVFSRSQGPPSNNNTMCHWHLQGTCQTACKPKSVGHFKYDARVWQTTGRQTTDHATEKSVAIGEIACARAISPKMYRQMPTYYAAVRLELRSSNAKITPNLRLSFQPVPTCTAWWVEIHGAVHWLGVDPTSLQLVVVWHATVTPPCRNDVTPTVTLTMTFLSCKMAHWLFLFWEMFTPILVLIFYFFVFELQALKGQSKRRTKRWRVPVRTAS